MQNDKNRINIMTSCDENLTLFILVQLKTMALHLKDKDVHFYLLYNRIPENKLARIENYCEFLGNITFHSIFIENVEPYKELVSNSSKSLHDDNVEREWPFETYFSFACNKYLPDDIDRIMYIDAGDVLFAGGIDEFYFDDFDGKDIIVSQTICKLDGTYFTKENMENPLHLKSIRKGVFNSGVYMINVENLRNIGENIEEIVEFAKNFAKENPGNSSYFFDQGLLAIWFLERTRYFGHVGMKDLWHVPYNFTLSFFTKGNDGAGERPLWYQPRIIHFMLSGPKPWNLVQAFVRAGILKVGEGESIEVDKLLKMAATTKKGETKNGWSSKPEEHVIEEGMIPFFKYWFDARDVVANELQEMEAKK